MGDSQHTKYGYFGEKFLPRADITGDTHSPLAHRIFALTSEADLTYKEDCVRAFSLADYATKLDNVATQAHGACGWVLAHYNFQTQAKRIHHDQSLAYIPITSL
jgi:hypothetical protein